MGMELWEHGTFIELKRLQSHALNNWFSWRYYL